ncbi:hypothetical protein [Ruegeria atlantica]|uniref:hypothetical protein n=1 Tax=Ruegeria atlantica TaxID=81569 RepID=UPI00147C3C77|nr:hypothetical protein [Ruegeria atlantica]
MNIGTGGSETKFVILFGTQSDLDNFVTHGYDAAAEAGAMYGDEREDKPLRSTNGRTFFVLSKKG